MLQSITNQQGVALIHENPENEIFHVMRTYDFLLVTNSNVCPILHRFRDTSTYWLKIALFFVPLFHVAPPLPMFPLEFRGEVNREETRFMGLISGESRMILTSTVFD